MAIIEGALDPTRRFAQLIEGKGREEYEVVDEIGMREQFIIRALVAHGLGLDPAVERIPIGVPFPT